jgi:ribosomal-protein-alanine N-acetyltransferase
MPFVITYDGELVGQLTVGGITWGSLRSAHVGYWIDRDFAGRGIVPTAVALATDHCFAIGLHRVEINIRPENAASRRVVEKLGFRAEGLRPSFLHIDGEWRDHLAFALTQDEVPDGVLARWKAVQTSTT